MLFHSAYSDQEVFGDEEISKIAIGFHDRIDDDLLIRSVAVRGNRNECR